MLDVVLYPNLSLLTKTDVVQNIDDDIVSLTNVMLTTMYMKNGVGLAANQVAINKRICVIDITPEKINPQIFINPEVILSEGEVTSTEGCLSFPGLAVNVMRPASITVKHLTIDGNESTLDATGLLAICLSHEIDHLDGITFIDKVSKLQKTLLINRFNKLKRNLRNR